MAILSLDNMDFTALLEQYNKHKISMDTQAVSLIKGRIEKKFKAMDVSAQERTLKALPPLQELLGITAEPNVTGIQYLKQ